MFVLGLQGSPRKKANTNFLLSAFMNEAEKLGARTHVIEVVKKNIKFCIGCGFCEKNGYCITQDDDMKPEIYPLFRAADVILLASPVYFYNVTAQLKALIDRSQALWSRKYKLNLTDPARNFRRGFLLSLGATKGKNLFEGVILTAKYFFDAVGAGYNGSLTYWQIENSGDMAKHPTVHEDVEKAVADLVKPLQGRKKVLFACRENACRSQMAGTFAQIFGGDKLEVFTGGGSPVDKINPVMVEVMEEKGVDMAFRRPQSLEAAIATLQPELIITMGCGEKCPFVPGARVQDWDLPDPAGKGIDFMRNVRDKIEKRVKDLISSL
ncbi:MAG: NAD(P)H-dependent oxidoreductase [Desulfobacterales bacterium]|uniref:NAD(P)H-dependent oxidoreductase n=1 Tax=Candidatus Desulfatibia profunda TaxID=2841695 RepID=A0A8J6NPQ6_9BACT|nr:NAD(P)H-dependent oxidoreductase [Candidatus Desulfatibia profunda]MBL7179214.1 NAD(P)H-dependent oxidoreductase [Desulfobacterales bacterium]